MSLMCAHWCVYGLNLCKMFILTWNVETEYGRLQSQLVHCAVHCFLWIDLQRNCQVAKTLGEHHPPSDAAKLWHCWAVTCAFCVLQMTFFLVQLIFHVSELFIIYKLERQSVECIYLWQRCSDDAVNKTILKPRLACSPPWEFADVKFHVAASSVAYTLSEKAIRFRLPDCGLDRAQKLISSSVHPCPDISWHTTLNPNLCMRFWIILLTDRQTGKHMYLLLCRR